MTQPSNTGQACAPAEPGSGRGSAVTNAVVEPKRAARGARVAHADHGVDASIVPALLALVAAGQVRGDPPLPGSAQYHMRI